MFWSQKNKQGFLKVIELFNDSKIVYVILRNYIGLPDTINSRDIDIAVNENDWDKACRIIEDNTQLIGAYTLRIVKLYGVKCYTLFFNENNRIITLRLDIEKPIDYKGIQLISFEELKKHSYEYNGLIVADEFMQALIVLLTSYKTGSRVKEKYEYMCESLVVQHEAEFRIFFERLFGEEQYTTIKNGILESYKYRNILWRHLFINHFCDSHKILKYYLECAKKQCSGCMISVHGPDGVGKTTFINALIKELMSVYSIEEKDIQYFHFRPSVFPNIKKLLTGKELNQEEIDNPHLKKQSNYIISFVRCFYYWLDYAIGYFVKVRKLRYEDKHVIFDRYFCDLVVDPYRARIKLPKIILKVFDSLVVHPDVSFILVCNPETIYNRKKELSMGEIQRQLDEYKHYGEKHKNCVFVNSDRNVEDMVREAVNELINKKYYNR